MGCRERATTDLQSLLSRSRRIGAIVRRLGGLLDSTRGESCLSGKRLRLIAPTAFWFQHDLVAVCDPGVGSWSSWHATARARPMSGCQATRSQDVCQSVNRVLPLTLTVKVSHRVRNTDGPGSQNHSRLSGFVKLTSDQKTWYLASFRAQFRARLLARGKGQTVGEYS